MNICKDQFFEAVKAVEEFQDPALRFVRPPRKYQKWLNSLPLPTELAKFLLEACMDGGTCNLGVADIFPWRQLIEANTEFPFILEGGFWIMGAAGNGDMVGVDWKHGMGKTGYLNHDALWVWDEEEYPDPKDHFRPVSDSIGEFALLATDMEHCPLDYYGTMPD